MFDAVVSNQPSAFNKQLLLMPAWQMIGNVQRSALFSASRWSASLIGHAEPNNGQKLMAEG
jgi:hypothetical protein